MFKEIILNILERINETRNIRLLKSVGCTWDNVLQLWITPKRKLVLPDTLIDYKTMREILIESGELKEKR